MNTMVLAEEVHSLEEMIASARAAVAQALAEAHYVAQGVVPEGDVFKTLAEPLGVIASCLGAIEGAADRCYLQICEAEKQGEVHQ